MKTESDMEIARLEDRLARVLSAAASALERCEVATDPSGAADEAAATLRQVVALDGSYVPAEDSTLARMVDGLDGRP